MHVVNSMDEYGLPVWPPETEEERLERVELRNQRFEKKYGLPYTTKNDQMVHENLNKIYRKYEGTYRGDVTLDRTKNPVPTINPLNLTKPDSYFDIAKQDNEDKYKASTTSLNELRSIPDPTPMPTPLSQSVISEGAKSISEPASISSTTSNNTVSEIGNIDIDDDYSELDNIDFDI